MQKNILLVVIMATLTSSATFTMSTVQKLEEEIRSLHMTAMGSLLIANTEKNKGKKADTETIIKYSARFQSKNIEARNKEIQLKKLDSATKVRQLQPTGDFKTYVQSLYYSSPMKWLILTNNTGYLKGDLCQKNN